MTSPLELVAALWPGSRISRRPGRRAALLVLPTLRSPRLLVPTGVPGARVMLKRHSRSRRQTLGQEVLALGVRSGLLGLLPVARLVASDGARSVDDVVRDHVPGAVRVGVLLGPPRANAKPVLQVFDADGSTLAFGKVGHDAAAAELVLRETAVLGDPALQTLSLVEAPRVLAAESWNGLEILLMTPMSSSQQRATSWELPVAEIHEVAESAPTAWSTVATSSYFADLRQRVDRLDPTVGAPLANRLVALLPVVSEAILGFGRWHGDWSRWNMGRDAGRLQLWDWEQSRADVPLGLDAVHFVLQHEFRRETGPADALAALLARTEPVLARWYSDQAQVEATVALYLLEALHRYQVQQAASPTPQLLARSSQLDSMLDLLTERLGDGPGATEPPPGAARQTPSGWSR